MPEELLDGADVVAVLEQVRGERVPQRVAAGMFPDAGSANAERDRALHGGFVEVVPSAQAAARIDRDAHSGEDVLPGKLASGVRVFALQRIGQPDLPEAFSQIIAMDAPRLLDPGAERLAEILGQHGASVLRALALDVKSDEDIRTGQQVPTSELGR
jgi:hypothetical protein